MRCVLLGVVLGVLTFGSGCGVKGAPKPPTAPAQEAPAEEPAPSEAP